MTTCDEIYQILKNPEKENMKNEFKDSEILRSKSGKEKLGYEIVAFANRNGGKLLIGIKDDASLEGKGIFDDKGIDNYRSIIDNICHNNISPIIEYEIEFLQYHDGDLLVVNVPKRKGIPHAYIGSKNAEIKYRTYYIRTSHGKRLVSDRQLQWLFNHQEDPDFTFSFGNIINYYSDSLRIPAPISQPSCISNYLSFVNSIPENDIGTLTKDSETLQSFFLEITPYALIHSFSWLFAHSWLIEIRRRKGKISSGPIPKSVSFKTVSVKDLPKPSNDSIIASLSWDFPKILESAGFLDFCIPSNTELQIQSDKGKKWQLSLKHNDFRFDIIFVFSSMCAGLHFTHPQRAILMDRNPIEGQEKMDKLYQSIEMDCVFKASFNFPEEDIELFDDYYHYANTIKDHLENDWDYDHFIQKLPHHKLYTIDNKLNDILRILEEKI